MKMLLRIFVLFFLCNLFLFPQQAQDYFPQSLGYVWKYKLIQLDTLNNPVNSSASYKIDSLAAEAVFNQLPAKFILSKAGQAETIKQQPYIDTNYINLNGSIANLYFKMMSFDSILANFDTSGMGSYITGLLSFYNTLQSFENWYAYYKFQQAVNSDYTIFQYDSTVTVDTLTLPLRFEIECRRLNDQFLATEIGEFTCKKFVETATLSYLVNLLPPPFPPIAVPIITRKDSVWFAPGNWIVKKLSPSMVVDLSLLNYGTYTIPGLEVNIISEIPIIVPVELISFSASSVSTGVLLEWETATELNNLGFEIERSNDNNSFVRVGFVKGKGTTTEKNVYSLTDKTAESKKYYYRLKQIDYDGKYTLSNSIQIEHTSIPLNFELSQNYPNPFNPVTTIRFSIPTSPDTPLLSKERGRGEVVTLKVYDMLGREVATIINEEKQPGTYEVEFSAGSSGNASGLSSGIYFYRLATGSFIETKKMILLR